MNCCFYKEEETGGFTAYLIMEKKSNSLMGRMDNPDFHWKTSRLWKVDMMIKMAAAVRLLH